MESVRESDVMQCHGTGSFLGPAPRCAMHAVGAPPHRHPISGVGLIIDRIQAVERKATSVQRIQQRLPGRQALGILCSLLVASFVVRVCRPGHIQAALQRLLARAHPAPSGGAALAARPPYLLGKGACSSCCFTSRLECRRWTLRQHRQESPARQTVQHICRTSYQASPWSSQRSRPPFASQRCIQPPAAGRRLPQNRGRRPHTSAGIEGQSA